MVDFNGTMYTYVHNLQGDIVAIVDSAGALVVEYKYDAWGKPVGNAWILTTAYSTLASLNPFRYRGYVWDEETELHYLRSRYYNPTWGRFVNADKLISAGLLARSIFAYCENCPANRFDSDGLDTILLTEGAIGAEIAVSVAGALVATSIAAALVVGAVFVIANADTIANSMTNSLLSKQAKKSDKARSTDKPSWLNPEMVDPKQSAQENAKRMLDDKYGRGNWEGPDKDRREFSKIVKWIHRHSVSLYIFNRFGWIGAKKQHFLRSWREGDSRYKTIK